MKTKSLKANQQSKMYCIHLTTVKTSKKKEEEKQLHKNARIVKRKSCRSFLIFAFKNKRNSICREEKDIQKIATGKFQDF